ncbi:hypothetical protein [Actinoallomurus bryophytorum]|uniref:hypothetical protein n=1 Tax=Actinoallomurus bryophytorum TaxID=1490222 RepID=UPI001151BFE8|nr:hypothetical protein [Actinoallomurus bryophytorum]
MPRVPEISEDAIRIASGIACYVVCGLLIFCTVSSIVWRIIFVVLAAGPSIGIVYAMSGGATAEAAHGFLLIILRRRLTVNKAPRGKTVPASSVVAHTLACEETEHAKHCREQGSPGNDPTLDVRYHLVIATYKINGNRQAIAFADGSSISSHPEKKIITSQVDERWLRSNGEDEPRAAAALYELIDVLYDQGPEATIEATRERLGSHHLDRDIDRALEAAMWWQLAEEQAPHLVSLTDSGRDWHLASAEAEAQRIAERKRMSRPSRKGSRSQTFNINGGIFSYAEGDISGNQQKVEYVQLSDEQVLSYIKDVLRSSEIPWSDPELVEARRVMSNAVAERDPHKPGLTQAISKLASICGDIVVGVLGNGAYQLLIQNFL